MSGGVLPAFAAALGSSGSAFGSNTVAFSSITAALGSKTALFGYAAALLSGLAWAVGSILFRRIGERASPSAMNLAKGTLGLVMLGVAAPFVGLAPIDAASAIRLAGSGVLGIAIGDTLFFAALVRLDPRVTLLVATIGHVFTVLLAVLLLGERPSAWAALGIGLVLFGVGAVLFAGVEAGAPPTAERGRGLLYGVLSAMATSGGLLLAKAGVADMPTMEAAWLRLFAGVLGVGVWTALRGTLRSDLTELRAPGLFRELFVAVAVVMFGGFWLSLVSLKYADAAPVTALAASEPLFVLPLARLWLGERIGARSILPAILAAVGVALIVAG